MRELVSKVEGGCMPACFHMASRATTRAAESYRGAVSLGQAKVQVSREFDGFLGGMLLFLEGEFDRGFARLEGGF